MQAGLQADREGSSRNSPRTSSAPTASSRSPRSSAAALRLAAGRPRRGGGLHRVVARELHPRHLLGDRADLVIHGDSDAIVPLEVSGRRTHEAIAGSELVVIEDGPHRINVSHAQEFNDALVGFLTR